MNLIADAEKLAKLLQEEVWLLDSGELLAGDGELARQAITAGARVIFVARYDNREVLRITY